MAAASRLAGPVEIAEARPGELIATSRHHRVSAESHSLDRLVNSPMSYGFEIWRIPRPDDVAVGIVRALGSASATNKFAATF